MEAHVAARPQHFRLQTIFRLLSRIFSGACMLCCGVAQQKRKRTRVNRTLMQGVGWRYLAATIFCVMVVPSVSHAQQTDFEGWFQYLANIGLDDDRKWVLTLEEQPRLGDDWHKLGQNLLRPIVNYNVNLNFSVAVGYAWTPYFYNAQYQTAYRDENRTFLQLAYKHNLWGLEWVHRLRQEQRFIENTAGSVANRTRYLVRANYPLSEDKNFGLTGYNEIFVNENGVYNGPKGGYDQDRLFFGPYMKIRNARYEVGFLEQQLARFGSEPRWAQVIMFMAAFEY